MKLKPILWTLFVVALVMFPWLAWRGRATTQVLSAASLPVEEVELPPASPATDLAPPGSDTAPVQPIVGTVPNTALPEAAEPEVLKPTNDPSNVKSNDNAPVATERPIGPIRKAELRIKDVPIQVQIKKAEVHFTEAYRLKNQNAARIAEELKKIVPELEITHDPATDSVVIQEMTPKMREFVTEVIRRLSAARTDPLAPQPSTPGATPDLTPATTQRLKEHPLLPPGQSPVLSPSPPVPPQNPTRVLNRDRSEVQDEVRRAFEARQESLRQEVAEFRSRIDRLVQAIKDRERSKDAIIERRVDELLNPNLRWDAAGNPLSGPGLPMGSNERHYPLVGIGTLVDGKLMPSATGSNARPEGMSGSKPERAQPAKELEFLSQYPRFSGLSLDMTETQFRAFLEQQKLAPQLSIPRDGQLNYSVPLGDGNRLTVMFGLDGKCRGIEPISGSAPSPILPHPATPAPVRAEKVVAKIFRLEQVDAASVAKTLQELASEKPFSARISADVTSNSVIVFANPDDMPVIEAIVIRLDMAPSAGGGGSPPKLDDASTTDTPEREHHSPSSEPATPKADR